MRPLRILLPFALGGAIAAASPPRLWASCAAPVNPIEAENCLPGNPPTEWDTTHPTYDLAGFTDNLSYAPGEVVHFKVNALNATSVQLGIYRLGWYGGQGARQIGALTIPGVRQPPCLFQADTELMDCGNWSESGTWPVPSNALSGVYIVKMKGDNGDENQMVFVVRNDSSSAAVILMTVDTTWQAYNHWQGYSLYKPFNHRALKVSYNRPFIIRLEPGDASNSSVFDHEYPFIRWLEKNAYDVTYFTHIDADRRGSLIKNHRVLLMSGHDEYWSPAERKAVVAARSAGVNMAFFTANEISWKTRWEPSIDGSQTPYRTLVCYKEDKGSVGPPYQDPLDPPTWTGLWYPGPGNLPKRTIDIPAPGGLPSNELTGNSSCVGPVPLQDWPMTVHQDDGRMRFWRNTSVAALPPGGQTQFAEMIGYEWDCDFDNGFRSLTQWRLSDSMIHWDPPASAPVEEHDMVLHRDLKSGSWIFGAGTMQWAWSLDPYHNKGLKFPPVKDIEQATVNLLADMGVQPGALESGLVTAAGSTDALPPSCSVTSINPPNFSPGQPVTVSGTAQDFGGGVVGGVVVSLDGGRIFFRANGRENWNYTFNIAGSGFSDGTQPVCWAVDDSGNLTGHTLPQQPAPPPPSPPPPSGPGQSINPTPALTTLDPPNIRPGGPTFTLTIQGSGFTNQSQAQWNTQPLTTAFGGPNVLYVTVPSADIASEITANVRVINPSPGGGPSNILAFYVLENAAVQNSVRAYPNPWIARRQTAAVMTFDHLKDGSDVKLFTLSGHWVRTLRAPQGVTTWDLKNDRGENVASGYYLFWGTGSDGAKVIDKVAVVR